MSPAAPARRPRFGPDSRFRWWLADLLNRSEAWCWSDLVDWVLYGPGRAPLLRARRARLCHARGIAGGGLGCYCGKVGWPPGYSARSRPPAQVPGSIPKQFRGGPLDGLTTADYTREDLP